MVGKCRHPRKLEHAPWINVVERDAYNKIHSKRCRPVRYVRIMHPHHPGTHSDHINSIVVPLPKEQFPISAVTIQTLRIEIQNQLA